MGSASPPSTLQTSALPLRAEKDEGEIARPFDGMDGDDVRVIQRSDGLGLALEASPALRVGGHLARQGLQRNPAVEARVFGDPDLSHPALAQGGDNLIVAELLADHAEYTGYRSSVAGVATPFLVVLQVPGEPFEDVPESRMVDQPHRLIHV